MRTIHYLNKSKYRLKQSRQFKRHSILSHCILVGWVLLPRSQFRALSEAVRATVMSVRVCFPLVTLVKFLSEYQLLWCLSQSFNAFAEVS